MWHFHRENGDCSADKVIAVEGVGQRGWPFPVPSVISDLVVSMDDRFLYFSNWLHGDLRQYDITYPAHPRLTGQLQLGGVLGRPSDAGRELGGGPQMLQLSLDGGRLYVTNSLYSTWDNQFYPGLESWLLRIDCDPDGGMEIDRDFFVDFHDRRDGSARAHEVAPAGRRLHDGDLPVTPPLAHVAGTPVEESLPALAPAAGALALAANATFVQASRRLRRRWLERGRMGRRDAQTRTASSHRASGGNRDPRRPAMAAVALPLSVPGAAAAAPSTQLLGRTLLAAGDNGPEVLEIMQVGDHVEGRDRRE